MKRLIFIATLLVMFIITEENECESFATEAECKAANPGDNKKCVYTYSQNSELACIEVEIEEGCQYNADNNICSIKEESETNVCHFYWFDEKLAKCQNEEIGCWDVESSKERCLKIKDCGYDETREYNKCYPVQVDEDCKFENNECSLSISSSDKTCSLIFDEYSKNYICKERTIGCSDFSQDSTNCLKLELKETNKVCSYDSSRSNNKCFEVLIEDECFYENENKKCTGEFLSEGKICDLDLSENPVSCKKRYNQCSDFDGDKTKCESAILRDKSKECSYNDQNKCIEKEIKAECIFDNDAQEKCKSTLSSKLNCELNSNKDGCTEKNVECSDFENDQTGCNDAIISNSNKKCNYESGQCTEVFKGCSDFSQ